MPKQSRLSDLRNADNQFKERQPSLNVQTEIPFARNYSYNTHTKNVSYVLVDDNKGLLGHFQKIKSSPSKVTDFKRLKRFQNSSEEISTRGEMILRFFLFFGVSQ